MNDARRRGGDEREKRGTRGDGGGQASGDSWSFRFSLFLSFFPPSLFAREDA